MSKTHSYEEMKNHIRGIIQGNVKSAGAKPEAPSVPEKDENESQGHKAPKDPEAAPAKQNLPPNKKNGPAGPELAADFVGSAPDAKVDGNAKDDNFKSPTTPIDKIAAMVSKIKQLKNGGAVDSPAGGNTPTKSATQSGGDLDIPFGQPEFMAKLAHHFEQYHSLFNALQASDEGMELMEQTLRKQAGAEAASAMIKEAYEAAEFLQQAYEVETQLEKEAQVNALIESAQQEELQQQNLAELTAFQEIWKSASEEDRNDIVKIAELHQRNINAFDEHMISGLLMAGEAHEGLQKAAAAGIDGTAYEIDLNRIAEELQITELEKAAYMQGSEDAAAMMENPEMDAPAEDAPASPEEIAAIIDELVQTGQLTEEQAAQIAAALSEASAPEEEGEHMKAASALCAELIPA